MAVTIESLRYHNGFTYRECEMPLANQGLVYLNGKNGHGKSTPFEVLQHTLFGTTSRGVKKDGIVCALPDSDGFLGELVLTNPDGRWLIRQSRNHSKHKTAVKVLKEVEGKWSARWEGGGCPKKLDDAQKLAGSLLGLQAHEFAGCMYLSQSGAHTLIEGTPAEKMRYVAQLFGIDVCDRMIVKLRSELKEAERLIVDVPILQAQLAERRAEADAYDAPGPEDMVCLDAAVDVAAQRKQQLQDIVYEEIDTVSACDRREQLQRQLSELGDVGDVEVLRQRAGKLNVRRDALRDLIAQQDERQDLEDALQRCGVEEDPDRLADKIERVGASLREAETLAKELSHRAALEAQRSGLPELNLEDVRLKEEAARTANAEAVAAWRSKADEVRELRSAEKACDAGVCPTCRQPLDLKGLQQMLERAELAKDDLARSKHATEMEKGRLGKLLEQVQRYWQLTGEIERLRSGDAEAAAKSVVVLRGDLEVLEARRHKAVARAQIQERLDRMPVGSDNPAALPGKLQKIEALIAGLHEQIELAGRAEVLRHQLAEVDGIDVEAAKRRLALAKEALDLLHRDADVVTEMRVRAKVAADDYQDLCCSIEEVESRLEELAEPTERVRVLDASINTIQKLKRRKLHQVVEAVRDCLPRFASTMFSHEPETRFVVSEDDESLDLACRRKVDGRAIIIPVKSMSGGEKQRLSVALVFTLHALLHARKKPDLLILDEVDRGLDDVGIASLMSLVRSVREHYGTVIMTSHRSQIAGAAFDRIWTVTKTNEVSRLQLDGSTECSA